MYLIFFKTNKIGNKFNKHFQDPKPMKSQFKSKKKNHIKIQTFSILKNISKKFINQRKEKKKMKQTLKTQNPTKQSKLKMKLKFFLEKKRKEKSRVL